MGKRTSTVPQSPMILEMTSDDVYGNNRGSQSQVRHRAEQHIGGSTKYAFVRIFGVLKHRAQPKNTHAQFTSMRASLRANASVSKPLCSRPALGPLKRLGAYHVT